VCHEPIIRRSAAQLSIRRSPSNCRDDHDACADARLVLNENEAFMQPGGAIIMDNWKPTLRASKLRGGSTLWTQLPETTPVISAFEYISGNIQRMFAGNATKLYDVTANVADGGQDRAAVGQLLRLATCQRQRRLT
jgi:hypothetical protein